MKDGRRRVIGPWILAGGLLVTGALVWLLAQPGRDAAETIPVMSGRAASLEVASAHSDLPAAAVERVEPEDAAAPPAAEPKPLTRTVFYSGRVVGVDGEGRAGATVWLIPDFATLCASQHPLGVLGDTPTTAQLIAAMSPSSFPSTESDAEGRFRIGADLLRERTAELPGRRAHPELFARQAGSRPALHVCREATDGAADGTPVEIDVGVLTLLPGVAVQGRAVDERLRPIAGVEVSAVAPTASAAGDAAQSALADFGRVFGGTRSNGDGRFRLEGLAESTDKPIRLSLELIGHDEVRREVFAVVGDTVELGDVTIVRGLAINGRVLDQLGRPLADVPVRLTDEVLDGMDSERHWTELQLLAIGLDDEVVGALGVRSAEFAQTTTGADGRFEIGGLAARTEYAVFASLDGREPARAARLAAGGPEVELRLLPRGELVLSLVEAPGGRPVTDATVRTFRRMGGYFVDPLELAEMPVQRDREQPSRFVVSQVCTAQVGVVIDSPSLGRHALVTAGLALGAPTETRVLEVGPGGTIGGTVVFEGSGAPVPGAIVMLTCAGPRGAEGLLQPRQLATGATGEFRFEGVEAGRCDLYAAATGATDASQELTLAPGETRLGLTIALKQAARFEGQVTVAGRGPAAGVTVVVRPSSGGWHVEGMTESGIDGRYTVEVTPGSWTLEFGQSTPGGEVSVFANASVALGQVTTVDAELPAPARLAGIALSAGRPVEGASIVAIGRGVKSTFLSDADGRFEQEVVGCGELTLIARSPHGGISEPAHVLVEPAGGAWAELRFGGRTLTGRVLDAASKEPVAMAAVSLLTDGREQPPEAGRIVTDAEGRFECEDVSIGEFAVRAQHPDYLEAKLPLTVASPDLAPQLTIELTPAHRLEGIVRTSEGESVTTTLLVTAWKYGEQPQGQAETDAEGRYRITGLPKGHYTLFVTPLSLKSRMSREICEKIARGYTYVRIEADKDCHHDIQLDPEDG